MRSWKRRAGRWLALFVVCALFIGLTNVSAASGGLTQQGGTSEESAYLDKAVPDDSSVDEADADLSGTDESGLDASMSGTDEPDSDADEFGADEDLSGTDESGADESLPGEDESEVLSVPIPDDMSVAVPSLTPEAGLVVTPSPLPEENQVGAGEVTYEVMQEGLYMFEVYPDGATQRALAIKGNSTEDYADLIAGTFTESNVRLFYIENVTGTYYRIRSLHTQKCLQVTSNKTANGTKVRQKSAGSTTAQQWQFVKCGTGYKIIGRTSGKALNVTGGSAANGATLEIRDLSDAPSQVWYPLARKPIVSGAGVSVTWPSAQCYTGKEIKPDVAVTFYGKALAQGTDYALTYTDNVKVGTATVTVTGRNGYRGRQTGTFEIVNLNYKKTLESGSVYYLVPKTGTTMAVGVTGNSIKNNASLSLIDRSNNKYKKFSFLKTTDGTFKILPNNSLYCLTGGNDGVLKLYTQQNTSYQRWTAVRDANGAFSFVNKATGQAITFDSVATSGSMLSLSEKADADNQKFYLLKSTDVFPADTVYIGQYNNNYVERFELMADVKPGNLNSKVSIFKQEAGVMLSNRNSGVYVDFAGKKIGIYKGFASGEAKKTLMEKAIPFALQAGSSYHVSVVRSIDCKQIFTFTDTATGKAVTLEATFADAGRAWGKASYVVDSGSVTVSGLKMRNLANSRPTLAILGDSYVEAGTLKEYITQRYASHISVYLDDDIYICARGSATSEMGVTWCNQFVYETVRPKYMLIAFGMNDISYNAWVENMQKMISLAEDNGITPILATIPPNANEDRQYLNGQHEKMSAWVRKRGYRYIDVAKALSKNSDGVTVNPKLYLDDMVHPNEVGHRKIYEAFLNSLWDIG
ncbi:MAG: RICIN domain-containing protein [Lachnospiraceae bacterium]|nr:RICIN domain-containing protein [Lachnospiraceae bacterium]